MKRQRRCSSARRGADATQACVGNVGGCGSQKPFDEECAVIEQRCQAHRPSCRQLLPCSPVPALACVAAPAKAAGAAAQVWGMRRRRFVVCCFAGSFECTRMTSGQPQSRVKQTEKGFRSFCSRVVTLNHESRVTSRCDSLFRLSSLLFACLQLQLLRARCCFARSWGECV